MARKRRRPRRPKPNPQWGTPPVWQGLSSGGTNTVNVTAGPQAGSSFHTANTGVPAGQPQWSVGPFQGPSGGGSAAAPGGSSAGPGAPGAPSPFDPQYDASVAGLGVRRDDALADIAYDEGELKQEFGFDDPSNPFSRARLLQRSYDEQKNRTTNSYASMGQLYSGAVQNARSSDTHNYDVAHDSLRRDYDRALEAFRRGKRDANRGYDEGVVGAAGERLDRQLGQPVEDPGGAPQQQSGGVSWATWNRWTPAQRARYRDRHRNQWSQFRPR
jgi:hypothetical protein